jgi:hypothetical protein
MEAGSVGVAGSSFAFFDLPDRGVERKVAGSDGPLTDKGLARVGALRLAQ